MKKLAASIQPSLIIIDTLSSACRLESENDNAEMAKMVSSLRRVLAAAAPSASLLLLHHMRKARWLEEDDLRGAGVLKALVDGALALRRLRGRPSSWAPTELTSFKSRAQGLIPSLRLQPEAFGLGIRLVRVPIPIP